MSTTVSYKGNTLTTVNNQTRTLNTAGKWLEGDIALTDTSIDLSQDTVTSAAHIASGYVGHLANGTQVTGTLVQEVTNLEVGGATVEGTAAIFDEGGGSGGSVIISDSTDPAGGTIREITSTDEVYLQSKTITPTLVQQTILPDTGYDGFSSVIVEGYSGGGTPSQT